VIAKLTEQMEGKKKELTEFQNKYNIRMKGEVSLREFFHSSVSFLKHAVFEKHLRSIT
jgi:hypothetical protein